MRNSDFFEPIVIKRAVRPYIMFIVGADVQCKTVQAVQTARARAQIAACTRKAQRSLKLIRAYCPFLLLCRQCISSCMKIKSSKTLIETVWLWNLSYFNLTKTLFGISSQKPSCIWWLQSFIDWFILGWFSMMLELAKARLICILL